MSGFGKHRDKFSENHSVCAVGVAKQYFVEENVVHVSQKGDVVFHSTLDFQHPLILH